jgi:hypothetical protein
VISHYAVFLVFRSGTLPVVSKENEVAVGQTRRFWFCFYILSRLFVAVLFLLKNKGKTGGSRAAKRHTFARQQK